MYTNGHFAVELFWVISGFIFAAVYGGVVGTTRSFVVARVARLYPLHLLTLASISILELVSIAHGNGVILYGDFDLYHFGLNLFFIQAWGWENGFSFNGPSWSISVELLIYCLFWAVHRSVFRWGIAGPVLLVLGFAIATQARLPGHVWECGSYFFAGCVVFVVHHAFPSPLRFIAAGLIATAGWWLVRHHNFVGMMAILMAIILTVAALEPWLGRYVTKFDWIGDNSYGVYLWHIPVQISLLLMLPDRRIFYNPLMLFSFLLITILLARFSFLWFERPQRAFWRRRLMIHSP